MNDWLPPGLFAYGSELAAAIDGRLGRTLVGDGEAWIDLPRRLVTADAPSAPVPWGNGALCVDLGPDDVETWERFAEVHRNEPDPDAVAVAAQEWRLPVTPYRRIPEASGRQVVAPSGDEPTGTTSIDGAKVVDLTSMWAGPLCTELLGRAGAEVHKVTSAARPDGLAGSPMYAELNAHKAVAELDLRLAADRRSFDQMLASADLLVTSLSPRGTCQSRPVALAALCSATGPAHHSDHGVRIELCEARLDRIRHGRARRVGSGLAGR